MDLHEPLQFGLVVMADHGRPSWPLIVQAGQGRRGKSQETWMKLDDLNRKRSKILKSSIVIRLITLITLAICLPFFAKSCRIIFQMFAFVNMLNMCK